MYLCVYVWMLALAKSDILDSSNTCIDHAHFVARDTWNECRDVLGLDVSRLHAHKMGYTCYVHAHHIMHALRMRIQSRN